MSKLSLAELAKQRKQGGWTQSRLDIMPGSSPRINYASQDERVFVAAQKNAIYDTTPNKNADMNFKNIFRVNQTDRSKDVGPASFRYANRTADRLMQAELSPFNISPIRGPNMYNKLRDEKYMPEKPGKQNKKGLFKRSDSSSDDEAHKKSEWAQYLPIIKSTDRPLAHLHHKTYFNQT